MIHLKKIKNNLLSLFLYNMLGLSLMYGKELQIGSHIPEINHKLIDISGKQITS